MPVVVLGTYLPARVCQLVALSIGLVVLPGLTPTVRWLPSNQPINMIIDLELHPKWSAEWSIEKREKATLALCTHLMNSKVHTIHGFHTDIKSAEPARILGASEHYTAKEKVLLTLEIEEVV